MAFHLPAYRPPDFSLPVFQNSPVVKFEAVLTAGVAPQGFHAGLRLNPFRRRTLPANLSELNKGDKVYEETL